MPIRPQFETEEEWLEHLRSWFAGQALPSVIGLIGIPEDGPDDLWDASIAERTYAIADRMLAERSKP